MGALLSWGSRRRLYRRTKVLEEQIQRLTQASHDRDFEIAHLREGRDILLQSVYPTHDQPPRVRLRADAETMRVAQNQATGQVIYRARELGNVVYQQNNLSSAFDLRSHPAHFTGTEREDL